MALRPCKSCKHQIDSSAKVCPSCGVSDPGRPLGETVMGLVILVIIIVVAAKFCSFGGSQANAADSVSPVTPSSAVTSPDGPEITKSPSWKYVVNNAVRTADDYAASKGSRASFINRPSVQLVQMAAGELDKTWVIQLVSETSRGVSYAQLKPLFDMQADADDLDDEGRLWEVVSVKFNGNRI